MNTLQASGKNVKYPPELYRQEYDMTYADAKAYQIQVVKALKEIFGNEMVKSEWDSVSYDSRSSNHTLVYAPRIDIAVGPFNSFADLDVGNDRTAVMRQHPLIKKLEERTEMVWNECSRCFLAIEIVFSGETKYIAGDFLNATSTGAIGFVVAHRKIYDKVRRMHNYFHRLDEYRKFGESGLQNLMVFDDETFLEFLWELKNPDAVRKLKVDKKYNLQVRRFPFPKWHSIYTHTMRHKPGLTTEDQTRLTVYRFNAAEILEQHDVVLMTTRYTSPSTAYIYDIVTDSGEHVKVMDLIDIVVRRTYRGRGFGTQMLQFFEKIARDNKCDYICGELGYDCSSEPIEKQKRFFVRNGFSVWSDKRAQYSEWVAKKSI